MKLRSVLLASLVLAPLSMSAQTAETTTPDPLIKKLDDETKIVTAQTALAQAQITRLKTEQQLDTQRIAPQTKAEADADAERAQREKEVLDSLAKLKDMASSLPSGTVTSSTGLVATPATAALALKATEEIAELLYTELQPILGSATVIFVDRLPTPADNLQLSYWLHSARELEHKFKDADSKFAFAAMLPKPDGPAAKSGTLLAASALAALPGAINGIAGLFRVDVTEKVGDAPIENGAIEALLTRKLTASTGTNDGSLPQVYASLDGLAATKLAAPSDLLVIRHLTELQKIHGLLTAVGAEVTQQSVELQARLTDLDTAVASHRSGLAALQARIEQTEEAILAAPETTKINLEALKKLLTDRRTSLLAKDPTDAASRKEILEKLSDRRRISGALSALLTEITAFISESVKPGTDGKLKILLLVRDELIYRSCRGALPEAAVVDRPESASYRTTPTPNVRFVTLKLTQKPESVIEKKFAWWRSYHASALIGVEYRVATPEGRVVAAGMKWRGFAQRLPQPRNIPSALAQQGAP